MFEFKIVQNSQGKIAHIETALSGNNLLNSPQLNKGCAFTPEEREQFQLTGLLPHGIETLEQQTHRMYQQYQAQPTQLGKNNYLNLLHDENETLFYKLVTDHLDEMLPIIYTPTVSEAVEHFSIEHRNPRGLYISYTERHHIDAILEQRLSAKVDLIVATDGEGVLGIGDQGIGGMHIASSKLMVYTLAAGINPYRTLPVQLDMGTNNQHLLNDPTYLGWRHERITGQAYDDFIDAFVQVIRKKLPQVFLHWEDLGRDNARRVLERYREQMLTINGDIQGTGTTVVGCILAATTLSTLRLTEHRIVIFGAGTAGIGIADELTAALQRHGLSAAEAKTRLWLIDKEGLLTTATPALSPGQKTYARAEEEITHWQLAGATQSIGLHEVVNQVKPTILIGVAAVAAAFTETVIATMAAHVEHPIIMPLSNPTAKSEATPDDLLRWTQGKAIIATGGPFPDVFFNQRTIRIAQSNNAFAFPGIGLGVIAAKAKRLTDEMMWAAAKALGASSPVHQDKHAPLLPKMSETRLTNLEIAHAIAIEARQAGLAQLDENISIETAINQASWEPQYYPYRRKIK